MEAHHRFSAHALPALSRHQETVAQDNCSLLWETVRRYSEETFTRIADGRLPQGGHDQAAIDILRIEIIAAAGKAPFHCHTHGTGSAHAAVSKAADWPRHQADTKNVYDRASMGAPCGPWNRNWAACDKAWKGESHGAPPNRFTQVCGYCSNVRRITTTHPEAEFYSKKSRERGAAGKKQSTSGF